MDKPEFKEGLFHCVKCSSIDTVALDLSHGAQPYDTLIWCSCGVVSVLDGNGEKIIHKF